ncbi:hypothetical protein DPMN_154070 [Dreissena polymorpha]|uniref:Uncharacterized protein n=1 Tax=Dreissena polymorpha TaxID=45954 RepID=A0A9D4JA02_DREPO|nr:hypothetical protein DPMN_154070 [Dreissena polymorpha]
MYELIFQTLGKEYCSRPVEVSANSTISVTEQLVCTFDLNRVTKASSRLDTRLPIGASVLSVFQLLESINKTIPKRVEIWRVPKDFSESKTQERTWSYKPPVPDPNSGLDFSKLPIQDPDMNKLLLTIPSSSTSVSVPYSILEQWEGRDRRALLEPGMNSLRAAPLSSGFLFGGKIKEALTADKDDQLHASLARNNSGQCQGAFKRPASRPPAGPVVKMDKWTNLFSKKPSWNPWSGFNISTPSNRPFFSHRSSVRNPAKKNKPQLDKRNSKPPVGRGGPPSYQP